MRALVALLIGLMLVLPGVLLLQQPRGSLSLLWDSVGLTIALLGTLIVLIGFGMALLKVVRGR